MEIGKLIRNIRLDKNINANILYKDILSRPSIVKFEKGESDTSAQKILVIIDRLNISFEEFELLLKKKNTNISFIRKYSIAFYNKDVASLEKLKEVCKLEYEKNNDEKFLHHQAIIQLLVNNLSGQSNSENMQAIKVLEKYLFKCDSWGYYELIIFTNSLSFYSEELIDIVYKRAKSTFLTYDYKIRYRNELSLLLLNILEKKIICKNIDSAIYYLNELKKLKVYMLDNMYIQTMIKFFQSIIKVINGEVQSKKDIIMIIEYLKFINLELKAEQCEKLFQHTLTNKI